MNSTLTLAVLATFGAAFLLALGPLREAGAQPPAQSAPPPAAARDSDHGTALMLLDRVATVLDAAIKGKSTKTGAVGSKSSCC